MSKPPSKPIPVDSRVIDINAKINHLRLVNKTKQIRKQNVGKAAINKLKDYEETAHRLLQVQQDLLGKPKLHIYELQYIQWYLEARLLIPDKNPLEGLILNWVEVLLDMVEKEIAEINRPKPVKVSPPNIGV